MSPSERSAREPMFNAPWPAVAIPIILVLAYLAQRHFGSDTLILQWGLSPQGIAEGQYETLITYLFLHGGWAHVAMNSVSAFAFGPPVARYFGLDIKGTLAFFIFFIVCGVLAGLGYVGLHWGGGDLAIGASGAISGLWGAASRLLIGRGRLAPVFDRNVLLQGAVFAAINIAIGLLGVLAAMNIAWEAHLAGYLAGLLLIGVAGRAVGRN